MVKFSRSSWVHIFILSLIKEPWKNLCFCSMHRIIHYHFCNTYIVNWWSGIDGIQTFFYHSLSLFLLSDISLTIRDESVARVAQTKEAGFWDLLLFIYMRIPGRPISSTVKKLREIRRWILLFWKIIKYDKTFGWKIREIIMFDQYSIHFSVWKLFFTFLGT